MTDYSSIKMLQILLSNAHKEGLREVRVSVKMLEEINEVISSLLINRASDYEIMVKSQNQTTDNNLTISGGSW